MDRALVVLIVLLGSGGADCAAPRLPLEYYADLPYVQSMALSPDGQRVAIVHNVEGNSVLVVRRPEDEELVVLLTGDNESGNIRWVRWANPEHVLVSVRYAAHRGSTISMETRLLSIPAKGGEPRSVLRDKREDRWGRGDKGSHVPRFQDKIVDILPDDPAHILVAWDLEEEYSPGVYRVNVINSRRKLEHGHRDGFNDWLSDQQHRIRVGVERREDEVAIHVKRAGGDFEVLWRYPVFSPATVEPLGFGLDPGVLYVRASHRGALAIFKVNLREPDSRELVLALPGQDVSGVLFHSRQTGEAVGVVNEDGRMRMWARPYTDFVAALENAFPADSVSLAGMSDDEKRYLLLNAGNQNPGTYYFGDRQTRQVSPIAYRYPQLTPDKLVGKKPVGFGAGSDTLSEGDLTLPAGVSASDLPAVILSHGGVVTRQGEFDYWAEFLANRGYAVLQVGSRGSTQFGVELLRAGLQGWGRTSPDDLVDARRWLVSEGVADPDRVCIVGTSYAGHAALMAAIAQPPLFRCVVSFAGATDLVDLVDYANRYDNAEVMETTVGSDKRELRRNSPAYLADKIATPVLLVHGSDDRVMRVHHGRTMHKALEREHKPHVYVEQERGNHFLSSRDQRLQLFREMETFLAAHLAPKD